MSRPNTLLTLLDEYSIEVPRVQRDYVHGRKDEHSTIVRTNLLNDIKSAYEGKVIPPKTQPETLDLNFVYGKTTEDKVFYPVDGQQRLTTLFLLHLYAFSDDETKTNILKKFSYQARTTTRDFFKKLVIHRKEVFSTSDSPEMVIQDAAWFVDSWKYDPSVRNALNTLNDIYCLGFNIDDLKKQLEESSNPRVYFQFVKLDELGMEDELYIKLNARGRALTLFENFKSRIIDRCTEACPTFIDEFKKKLDGSWTEYIWAIAKEQFDAVFLRYFETILLNAGIIKSEANKSVSNNWVYQLDYESVPSEIFVCIRNMLSFLSLHKNDLVNKLVETTIISSTPYANKVLFHAVNAFLSDENDANTVDNNVFNDWLRLFLNLVNNSRIEEADDYQKAVQSIDRIKAHKNDLLLFLASGTLKDLSGFSKEQFTEECQKARIMCKSAAHKKVIIDAEIALPYFSGQIRSIIHYSDFENTDNFSEFDRYLNSEKVLFDNKKPIHGKLLRRTLCAIDDYRLPVGSYKTLCIDDPNESSRTPSLKRLFSNHGSAVKELLDNINASKPIEAQLKAIISGKTLDENDWRYCFVNYTDVLFPLMSTSHLRMFENGNEELIIPNKQSNGENYSVYLYTLQHLLRKKSIISEYYTELGAYGDRYLIVKGYKVRYKMNKFYIESDSVKWKSSSKNVLSEALTQIMSM